jgi:transcriptional regulator with XRE-family HTH domain
METAYNQKFDGITFGNALKRAAKRKGKLQENLASELGIHVITLGRVLNGRRLTTLPNMLCLCNILEITPDYLLTPYLNKPEGFSRQNYTNIISKLNQLSIEELAELYKIMKLLTDNRA